jgi:hypothetical protein
VEDAVRFISGLNAGADDLPATRPVGEAVLALMRKPKLNSEEPLAGTFTVQPRWGAGEAFRSPCWRVAYKAGWGGAQAHIPWLGAQMGTVALPEGHTLAFAVAVHPYRQPSDDDPGTTPVPRAIALVLSSLRPVLEQAGACSR